MRLAQQYLHYAAIYEDEFNLRFAKSDYTTERFLVTYFNMGHNSNNYAMGGYVVVYDFKSMKGILLLFSSTDKFDYRLVEINGIIDYGVLVMHANYARLDSDYYFIQADDPLEDTGYESFEYFKIINDGDDETVLSQLNASLMKLSRVMNL